MENIIIRMPNFIGDSINTIPAIELVKQTFPDARISLLGPSFLKDLFKYDPRINNIIISDKKDKKYLKNYITIYKNKYDLGILFTNTFISAFILKLAFIKQLIGYNNEARGILLSFKRPLNRNIHYINKYATLINEFTGNKYTYLPPLKLYYKKEKNFQFNNNNPVIGLYLGGENKGFRKYPEKYSLQLLNLLNNYNIILVGDANDAMTQSNYARQLNNQHNILDLSGKTTVEELITTISNLDLLITIDSAAMHIAAAVNTKFIALMGLSTSPTSTITPKTDLGIILKIENNMINEANYIQNITPEIIYQNLQSLLNNGSST